MCQNEATEKEQTGKRIKKITPAPIKNLYQQAKLAEIFLELIKDTLERCQGLDWGEFEKKIEFSLLFETYDAETLSIGYVGEDVYLLDSKFIHQRFGYFLRETGEDFGIKFYAEPFFGDMLYEGQERLYARLFQIGILTPYKKSKTKPICTIWYNKGSEFEEQTECICIPKRYVDFDVKKMKVR